MINANEIRVGNWIKFASTDTIEQVNEICSRTKFPSINKVSLLDDVSPIPLTPDILGKCGFVSNPYQDRYELGDLHFEHCGIRGIVWCEKYPHIKYLHQLQNLVFFTKETELNYTP